MRKSAPRKLGKESLLLAGDAGCPKNSVLLESRSLNARYFRLHSTASLAFEAFELLNPLDPRPNTSPLLHKPYFVAVSRRPYKEIVTGFHDYRRLPKTRNTTCFVETVSSEDPAALEELAWNYVFARTSWRSIANAVLAKFYERYLADVPTRVLLAHQCVTSQGTTNSNPGPQEFCLFTGMSRKTLHRHCATVGSPPIDHLTHDELLRRAASRKK